MARRTTGVADLTFEIAAGQMKAFMLACVAAVALLLAASVLSISGPSGPPPRPGAAASPVAAQPSADQGSPSSASLASTAPLPSSAPGIGVRPCPPGAHPDQEHRLLIEGPPARVLPAIPVQRRPESSPSPGSSIARLLPQENLEPPCAGLLGDAATKTPRSSESPPGGLLSGTSVKEEEEGALDPRR